MQKTAELFRNQIWKKWATECSYNFLNFLCSNIFLGPSLIIFQFHSGSKAVYLKRSATFRPSVLMLVMPSFSMHFNPSFTGKQVPHTRKYFLTVNLKNFSNKELLFVPEFYANLSFLSPYLWQHIHVIAENTRF